MAITTGLEEKPWYYGVGVGLVVAIALVAATHYLLVTKINEEIVAKDRELDELAKKIEAGRAAEKKLPQFREEVARLELELEKLRRILPSTRNTEEMIKKIKSLVDQGDFTLRSLVFPRLATGGGEDIYAEWPISVSVEGGFHNLAILFNRLGNFSRIVNVERFTITALGAQATNTIAVEFIAKTFVYMEPKDEVPAATGKAKPGGGK
ncbi:MAG TPA: type 4a pilus biogenesis protein PilO [Thermoanaerobaculia bacterium]|nr:type 4a pilus biogenesis protein PilO [Thermoanaerobaculia bacterium]